jgi:hypothetical protein
MSGSIYSGSPATSQARGGTAYCTVNGEVIDIGEDLSWDATVVTRESLVGLSGPQGYSEKPKVGQIKMTVRDAGNLSVTAFNALTDATVILSLINGKTITGDSMRTTEVGAVNAKDGTFEVTFEGDQVIESN